jgi:hypothetical protein
MAALGLGIKFVDKVGAWKIGVGVGMTAYDAGIQDVPHCSVEDTRQVEKQHSKAKQTILRVNEDETRNLEHPLVHVSRCDRAYVPVREIDNSDRPNQPTISPT